MSELRGCGGGLLLIAQRRLAAWATAVVRNLDAVWERSIAKVICVVLSKYVARKLNVRRF